jgi:GntR family transcriptional regulator
MKSSEGTARAQPIYLTLAGELEALARALSPNVLFPTEDQLAQRYGVSRPTVRRALSLIEAKGLVRREQGRGTIVCPPKFERRLVPPRSIIKDFRDQGYHLDSRTVSLDENFQADPSLHRQLAGKGKGGVVCLRIVRSVADEALVYETHIFQSGLLRKIDLARIESESLSKLLVEGSGLEIVNSRTIAEIEPCNAEVAFHLSVSVGTQVVIQRFQDHLASGRLLQAGEMHYRTDRIRFSIVQNGSPYADGEADLLFP